MIFTLEIKKHNNEISISDGKVQGSSSMVGLGLLTLKGQCSRCAICKNYVAR
jgi:hypothetical protein